MAYYIKIMRHSFSDFVNREAELITSIKRSIGNYVRNGKKFYIGICSGTNRERAMERRVDDYKKQENLNKMIALFEADDQDTVRNIEGQLIRYYRSTGNEKCKNRAQGGGGRNSKGPKYQVYIAIEE